MLETVLAGLKWTGLGLLSFSATIVTVGITANKISEMRPILLNFRKDVRGIVR